MAMKKELDSVKEMYVEMSETQSKQEAEIILQWKKKMDVHSTQVLLSLRWRAMRE